MDKEDVELEYYSAVRKKEILHLQLEWTLRALYKWNKSERKTNNCDSTFMWTLQKLNS